jgi:hypothetical protein
VPPCGSDQENTFACFMRSDKETKYQASTDHDGSSETTEVLDPGSTQNIIPGIAEPSVAGSKTRLAGGSRFGFHKPFRFFDLLTRRSESPSTGFAIGSLRVDNQRCHQKIRYASSAFRCNNRGCVFLIIPWSQVRVLAGPPLPIKIIVLCRWDQGIIVPWCVLWRGWMEGGFRGSDRRGA